MKENLFPFKSTVASNFTYTCEEIIVTEMIFEGIRNGLEPAEIVAVSSTLSPIDNHLRW